MPMNTSFMESKAEDYVSQLRQVCCNPLSTDTENGEVLGISVDMQTSRGFELDCREMSVYEDMKPFGVCGSEVDVSNKDTSDQRWVLSVTCARHSHGQTP